MIALFLLLQAATTTAVPPAPERFSILVDPCAAASKDGKDIVVCGSPNAITPRLPMPEFRGPPDHAVPSNPEMSAAVALNGPGVGYECGAYSEDCPVGFGGQAIPALVNGAVGLVKDAFAKKPDKRGRVPIDLSEPKLP